MNYADITVLLLLVAADVCLIAFLRRRRARYMRMDRMTRSLQMHLRSEIASESPVKRRKPRVLATR